MCDTDKHRRIVCVCISKDQGITRLADVRRDDRKESKAKENQDELNDATS